MSTLYRVEVGAKAEAQLASLDPVIGTSVERKVLWLAANATGIIHHRLVGMPDDLAGLCRLRIGDYRVLYWVYHDRTLIRLYRIQHRSEVYRDF